MTKGAFRLPIIGGAAPDPFPASDGWTKILEFQTNSPSTTTFDPTITSSSGLYGWDLGDGTIIYWDKAISHTYADSSTKTVKLYGKGTCNITTIDFTSDAIVGTVNLTNNTFKTTTQYIFSSNSGLTSVLFNSSPTATISRLMFNNCRITGTVDVSMFSTWASSNTYFWFEFNSGLTGFNFPASTTGYISQFHVNNCGITGTFNMSAFSRWTTGDIRLNNNPSISLIVLPSTITGSYNLVDVSYTGISSIDLSQCITASGGGQLSGHHCPNLSSITLPSSPSGSMVALSFNDCALSGTINISQFTNWGTVYIAFQNNPLLTTFVMPSSVTSGTVSVINFSGTGISSLNLSCFTAMTTLTNANSIYLYNMANLTSISFASSISGPLRTMYIYNNPNLGYINLSGFSTGFNNVSLGVDLQNNGWTAGTVNHILYDINSVTTSGYAGRTISIGGTNADPDTTSGGYDGVAARNSLIAKGFTVSIT